MLCYVAGNLKSLFEEPSLEMILPLMCQWLSGNDKVFWCSRLTIGRFHSCKAKCCACNHIRDHKEGARNIQKDQTQDYRCKVFARQVQNGMIFFLLNAPKDWKV